MFICCLRSKWVKTYGKRRAHLETVRSQQLEAVVVCMEGVYGLQTQKSRNDRKVDLKRRGYRSLIFRARWKYHLTFT